MKTAALPTTPRIHNGLVYMPIEHIFKELGYNANGQLEDGTTTGQLSPVQILR